MIHSRMRPRQMHAAGIAKNYGPRAARTARELRRMTAGVRKVLWRRPGRLVLWVERDLAQARHHGRGFFSNEKLGAPYTGRVVGIGWRALLILTGRAPE